jgi:hypothetical protein
MGDVEDVVEVGVGVRPNVPVVGTRAIVQGFQVQKLALGDSRRFAEQKKARNSGL